ncbi:hypothetical protein Vadar_004444 [Vaccinium darrowii]|uniref:Uncharacterized protein n=1 Tax=Vaccinium darrowii TaxID=229202 RepID=A0ACB7YSY9_9ERIC|nr:hypothetical protein Vadar_004444 [Vaccinium darrowii]
MVNSELNRVTSGGVGDARVSCDDQLKPCETDSSAISKLKALNRELHQLLAVKFGSPTPPVVLAKPNSPVGVSSSSWKDLVVGTTGALGLEVEELGISKWKNCLVGHFLDKKLPFPVVHSIAMKIWKKFGLCDVSANGGAMDNVGSVSSGKDADSFSQGLQGFGQASSAPVAASPPSRIQICDQAAIEQVVTTYAIAPDLGILPRSFGKGAMSTLPSGEVLGDIDFVSSSIVNSSLLRNQFLPLTSTGIELDVGAPSVREVGSSVQKVGSSDEGLEPSSLVQEDAEDIDVVPPLVVGVL